MNAPLTYVLDANLLLRLSAKNHPHHAIAVGAVRTLRMSGAELRTVPQALFEFWVVATREPRLNGLGLNVEDAENLLNVLTHLYPPLADDPSLVTQWRLLIARHGIIGKHAHDVRYIAALKALGFSHFLTFDAAFQRYASEGIVVVDPSNVIPKASETN